MPKGTEGTETIKPLPLDGAKPNAETKPAEPVLAPGEVPAPKITSPVEKFLADEAAGKVEGLKPAVETPSGEKPASEIPAGEKPAVEAKPEGKPAAEKPATPAEKPAAAPAGEKPATEAPVARTYAPDETFALAANADGSPIEWTREQIVERIQQANIERPMAEEAKKFRDIFLMDAASAERDWKPLMERLRDEPHTFAYLQRVLSSDVTPEKAKYLADCADFYDREAPAPAKPAGAQDEVPVAVQRRLDALEAQNKQNESREFANRASREWTEVTRKYPFFLQDQKAGRALWALADSYVREDMANGVPMERRRGLLDAIADNQALYDARLTVWQAQHAPPPNDEIVPPENKDVPTLLGSGASPTGARRQAEPKEHHFKHLDDAVAAAVDADLTR